jgi:hypothetical protein
MKFPYMTGARPDPLDLEDFKAGQLAGAALLPEMLDNRNLFPLPVEDQIDEGVCVGTTVAGAQQAAYAVRFSISFAYAMAQIEDFVPDDVPYEGSTLRAGLKGWHKYGAVPWDYWPFEPHTEEVQLPGIPEESMHWPLTRYERLDISISGIQAAVKKYGCVLVTGEVHSGWARPNKQHRIKYSSKYRKRGCHAYLIVGWEDDYWLLRNSWGTDWGDEGYAWLKYDDFIANASDVWIAVVDA